MYVDKHWIIRDRYFTLKLSKKETETHMAAEHSKQRTESNASDWSDLSSINTDSVSQQQQPLRTTVVNYGHLAKYKTQDKYDELSSIAKDKIDEIESKIESKTTEIISKYSKNVNKITNKQIPNNMYALLCQATKSLDKQLTSIHNQLLYLKKQSKNKIDLTGLNIHQLSQAKALVFISELTVKFIGSAAYGRGIVIAKLDDNNNGNNDNNDGNFNGRWSQPCAIETVEIGAGWQIGVSRTHYIIPLYNKSQIDALLSDDGIQVSLNGSIQFAFGNDGRLIKGMISGSDKSISNNKSGVNEKVGVNGTIADVQGFELGTGVGISVIQPLIDVNNMYFWHKKNGKMSDILKGNIKAPTAIVEIKDTPNGDEKYDNNNNDDDDKRTKMIANNFVKYRVVKDEDGFENKNGNDNSEINRIEKERNELVANALEQYTVLISMLNDIIKTDFEISKKNLNKKNSDSVNDTTVVEAKDSKEKVDNDNVEQPSNKLNSNDDKKE